MRFLLFAFSIILGFATLPVCAEHPVKLRELVAKYEAALSKVVSPLTDLEEAYSKRLAGLKAEAQKEGDLGGVLAIDREMTSFRHRLEKIPANFSSLEKASAEYESRRETELGNLRSALERLERVYLEQLGALQTELTKAGRFEDALHVKEFAGLVKRKGEPDSTDMVARWKLDGNAEDSGPGKHHGRDYGTSYVNGRIGSGSASFGKGRYVLISNRAELNLLSPFTVSAWIHPKPGANGEGAPIVSKGTESWRLHVFPSGESVGFSLKDGPEGLSVQSPPGSLEGGRWQHVAAVFNGKDLFLYIDGVRVAEDGKHTYEMTHESESDLGIGYDPANPESAFQGAIDDIRIYNRVLQPMEIEALAEQ